MKPGPTIQYDKSCGRYYVRLQCEGVRRRFWLGEVRKEAPAKLKAIQAGIATGEITFTETETTATTTASGDRDMRIEELAHRYLEWVSDNRSANTYATRRCSIQAFLEFVGPCMVSQITRLKLMDFHAWARKNRGHGSIVTLGQLMGHTNTRTTARYITATAAHHRQLVEHTAQHVLSLLPESGAEEKNGQKVASKLETEKQEGGRIAATASPSTT